LNAGIGSRQFSENGSRDYKAFRGIACTDARYDYKSRIRVPVATGRSSPLLRGARRSGRGEFAFLFAVAILPPPFVAGVSRPLRDYVVIGCGVIVGKLRDTDDESARISRARHFIARSRRMPIETSPKLDCASWRTVLNAMKHEHLARCRRVTSESSTPAYAARGISARASIRVTRDPRTQYARSLRHANRATMSKRDPP